MGLNKKAKSVVLTRAVVVGGSEDTRVLALTLLERSTEGNGGA